MIFGLVAAAAAKDLGGGGLGCQSSFGGVDPQVLHCCGWDLVGDLLAFVCGWCQVGSGHELGVPVDAWWVDRLALGAVCLFSLVVDHAPWEGFGPAFFDSNS